MILVEVTAPALNGSFDFRLDETLRAGRLASEMGRMLFGEAGEGLFLCSYDQERILPPGRSLWQCGIGDGARLLLI